VAAAKRGHLLAFAGLSASYFAHIGFFNPYLPLWLKDLGLPIFTISLLASVQSITRVFAPYAWGALSDHTGQRVKLLRFSAAVALASSFGLWWNGGAWWLALVLLVMFTHTSSMMSLTEAAMAQLVAGDWGRYGRIRLCGSAGFLLTVFVAGEWFDRFGMKHFPAWAAGTLAIVLIATMKLPDVREPPAAHGTVREPIGPVLRSRAVQWFFASLFFQVMSHFSVYAVFSLYLDSIGYGKSTIGLLWALSVVAEIVWFFLQGRLIGLMPMPRWMLVCGRSRGAAGADRRPGRMDRRAHRGAVASCAEFRGAPHDMHRHGVASLSRSPARARAGAVHGHRLRIRRRARCSAWRRGRAGRWIPHDVRGCGPAGRARQRVRMAGDEAGWDGAGEQGLRSGDEVSWALHALVTADSYAARSRNLFS